MSNVIFLMPLAGLVLFILCLVLAFVDLFLVLWGGTGKSVSSFMLNLGFGKGRFTVFAFGCTIGHLFFYMYQDGHTDPGPQRWFDAACGAVAALSIRYLYQLYRNRNAAQP